MRGHRHVRQRIVTLFVLGIALPSGLLGYLAFRGIRNDQALFEREQREELERAAEGAFAAHDTSLTSLGRRFAALLGRDGGFMVDENSRELGAFGSNEPLVDALFHTTVGGEVDTFLAPSRLYRQPAPALAGLPIGTASSSPLARARRAELRDGNLGAALTAYDSVRLESRDERERAEAVNAIARIHRSQGNLDAAAEGYRRLVSEYPLVSSAAGIPFGIAGHLELMRVHELSEQVQAAGREATHLLRTLLGAEYELSEGQYAFVASRVRSAAGVFLEDSRARLGPIGDSLRTLLEAEAAARARTDRVDRFRAVAERDPGVTGRRVTADTSSGLRREAVRIDGEAHHVIVVEQPVPPDGPAPGEWGLLLSPIELSRSLEMAAARIAGPNELGWSLRTETGALVAGAVPQEGDSPSISLNVPDRFPDLTLQLFAAPTEAVESFFTSPRSVYLYAFVLVAGLLAFGLVFTVRTLSHQLALSRMQSDFVSTVSHEFKSPVTAIRQLAEMLRADRVPSEDRRRRYYDVLVEQSERLTALMDHILDFAKMDGGYELERRDLDPGPHLEDVVSRVEQRVRHQGYTVRQEIQDELPVVHLDPDAIALAVTNLIDNGIKYSGGAREVVVRAAARNGDLEIAVQDFGIGLDPADREHVFERFYRGGNPLTRSVKGTGLGLTLVKQIVDAHGGSIDVQSEVGEGSTFTIRLPTGAT